MLQEPNPNSSIIRSKEFHYCRQYLQLKQGVHMSENSVKYKRTVYLQKNN